ncbi:MAG: DUF2844 domain-containing protein [Steroidobacteraceae bacterium]
MKRASRRAMPVSAWMVAAVILGQAGCMPAQAALGGDVSSVQADRQHIKGQLRVTAAAGYSVHEIRTPTNTIVREYVSPAGRVFAVSWRGPLLPDLRQTLGAYFAQYQAAAGAPHAGHRHLSIRQPDLIVHSNGHMRAFSGYAYVPALLPPSFSLADVK